MTVRERGSSYQADFMFKGTRHRETFDTYSEAHAWEQDAKHALKMGRPIPQAKNKRTSTGVRLDTLRDLKDHVVKTHWKQKKSASSLIANAEAVVELLGPSRPVAEITKADLDDVVADLLDAGMSPATCNRKMAAMSKLLTEAAANGLITRKPPIPRQQESQGRIRWLTKEEETHILGLFITWGQLQVHDFTVVAIDTGFRLSELLNIEWRDISSDGTMLHIWKTKTDLARSVPLTKRAREAIHRQDKEQIGPFTNMERFGSLRTVYQRMRETTGYEDVTVHVMRHTCASRLAQTPGINLQYVQKWLGHKSITTTMRYAHLAPASLEHCKQALENFNG